jgi:putative aldouronate transport system permease protein
MAANQSAAAKRKVYSRYSSPADRIFDTLNVIALCFLMFVTLYPFINMLAVSLNDAGDSIRGNIYFWPRIFTWDNYRFVFKQSEIFHATLISVARAVVGSLVPVFCTAMVAYTISRPEFVLRKFVTIAFVLTMYIDPGLIPSYLLIRDLHLIGTFWVYIVPGLVYAFNLILIRSFIEGLPEGILESARIDGAGEFKTFTKIVLPLCVPALATVGLFNAVYQWNDWIAVFLYNSSHQELSTLQFELMKMLANTNSSSSSGSLASSAAAGSAAAANNLTPTALRATMTIVASVPIICVYPFLQKYFVKGMTLGGVKG